jgi:hypothetical protein
MIRGRDRAGVSRRAQVAQRNNVLRIEVLREYAERRQPYDLKTASSARGVEGRVEDPLVTNAYACDDQAIQRRGVGGRVPPKRRQDLARRCLAATNGFKRPFDEGRGVPVAQRLASKPAVVPKLN